MKALEAHGEFATWPDLGDVIGFDVRIAGVDGLPAFATALVDRAGMLEECTSREDLLEAIAHGRTLLSAEIISIETLKGDALEVIDELMAWGQSVEAGRE